MSYYISLFALCGGFYKLCSPTHFLVCETQWAIYSLDYIVLFLLFCNYLYWRNCMNNEHLYSAFLCFNNYPMNSLMFFVIFFVVWQIVVSVIGYLLCYTFSCFYFTWLQLRTSLFYITKRFYLVNIKYEIFIKK